MWADPGKNSEIELSEVGPRFVLDLIRIFSGSFGGETLYQNPFYVSPNLIRSISAKKKGQENQQKTAAKHVSKVRKQDAKIPYDEIDTVLQKIQ